MFHPHTEALARLVMAVALGVVAVASFAWPRCFIGVAGFFGQCFAEWMGAPIALDPFLSPMILGLSSATLVAGLSVSPNIFGKIGARLGAASYAIYLAHYPAIGALHLHHPTGSAVKIFFIYAALGIVAGLAFHALIEKPLLAWLRGFQPRRDRLRPKIA